jgi:5-amino-6-(5-phosphoribosylamino)uracil reductase
MSVAMSVDGCIDDRSPRRLVLSDEADLDEVDELRAGCDAIMVGANTVRRDNPRLLIRSVERQERRVAAGRSRHPLRVTVSAGGRLDPSSAFFCGPGPALVYSSAAGSAASSSRDAAGRGAGLGSVTWVPLSDLPGMLADLRRRGVSRLLVEGGQRLNSSLLAAGVVDELRLAIAPMLIGDPLAPRVAAGAFDLRLRGVRTVGRMAVLDYGRGDD